MERALISNIAAAKRKADASEALTEVMFREAAVQYGRSKTSDASVDEACGVYRELCGCEPSLCRDYALFCREFAAEITIRPSPLAYSDDDTDGGIDYGGYVDYGARTEEKLTPQGIAYMQNSFSDKAYRVFASGFDKIPAVYFPGFKEAAEEVYYGRSSHAILPVFNSHDGMLMSFYRILLRYDLRINASCDIGINDDDIMRYALVSKHLSGGSGMRYVDISVVLGDGDVGTYGSLLSSCEALGASVLTLNSHPLEYSDDGCGLIVQLKLDSGITGALRLLLDGSHVRYTMIGEYGIN